MSSSSRPWFSGRISPCSMTRSALGSPPAGARCGTFANAGCRVTLPVHTMRVSTPCPSMCSWNSARRIPDSGRMRTGNMCHPVSSSSVWRGSTNTSGYVPKNADSRSKLR